MATPAHSDLAYSLTKFYFGDVAGSVIHKLFSYDQLTLKTLRSELPGVKFADLKKTLLVLVKHQLVDYAKSVKNFRQQYEYSIVPERIYSFFRIPRLIPPIIEKQGQIAGIIIKSVAEVAMMNTENLVKIASGRAKMILISLPEEDIKSEIGNVLEKLISSKQLVTMGSYYCLNIERLIRGHRDCLITDAISSFYQGDAKVRFLCEALLRISSESTDDRSLVTAPVPISDLTLDLVPNKFTDRAQLEKYLARLTTENNNRFIVSSGVNPHKGPMYAVDVGLLLDYVVKEHLSSMIDSRFGPKCCRVFRVLLHRGPLMLKQIEEFIMLPAKDVREYSYMLIKEGFIKNQQVPKTPDNAPGKSVFIMSVEMDQIVFQAADHCCRTISNLLSRREFELCRNKALFDRSKAVTNLLAESNTKISDNSAQEIWTQYFNSHELSQLDTVNRTLNRIFLSKFQVDETLFLLHAWIALRPDLREDIP